MDLRTRLNVQAASNRPWGGANGPIANGVNSHFIRNWNRAVNDVPSRPETPNGPLQARRVFPSGGASGYYFAMLREHEIEIRVRYQETDGQGRLHHCNFFTYFEMGRTELLRASGITYRQIEEEGWMLVVSEISCKYLLPANYDDVLRLRTSIERTRAASVIHEYRIFRGDTLLAQGRSVLACIDREGRLQRLPDALLEGDAAEG